ncbi:TPT-domain-containing protein [Trametes coccinea BRFM310]|uniref:TPT-domain-containing protein n=1 Tax=Trametes coccinea (strain BRFM310) TaxID=1353009 RepID=A0A1Y2ITB0_TRAC3|nr:TPT-domain-containing protein [Trametes coccinea BRFM310]
MPSPQQPASSSPGLNVRRHSVEAHSSPNGFDHAVHLASLAEKKRLWWTNALINSLFIASWFFFATLISIYNKWMFSPEHYGFPSPLFVTTIHMWVQFLLAAVLRYTMPRRFKPEHRPTRADYIRKAVPTGVTTGLDIGFSNLSLKLITLSFYTMCKSSSLVFVLLFAFLLRLETFSFRLVGVIILICIGVLLMVATETHFVLSGFLLVTSASALGGLRWSLTQLLLRNKKMGMSNPAATLFWLAPIMGITLSVTSIVVDGWSKIFRSQFFASPAETMKTLFFLFCPGVLAFCMVLSEFYIIQRAGVVPMSIAGIAKEVTTIIFAAWVFGDELTPLNITGVAITTCGIGLYTYHKYTKSLDKNIALDPHGNPLPEEESVGGDVALEDGYGGEMQRLTEDVDEPLREDPEPEDPQHRGEQHAGRELLFSVADDEDEEMENRPPEAQRSESLPPPYSEEGAEHLHHVWGEEERGGR